MSGTVPSRAASSERGAGTVLAVGIVGATVLLAAGLILVAGAVAARAGAAAAADLSALAAADVAVGRAPGIPCSAAEAVAVANGARLAACSVDEVVVTVTVAVGYAGMEAHATARGGPPGSR